MEGSKDGKERGEKRTKTERNKGRRRKGTKDARTEKRNGGDKKRAWFLLKSFLHSKVSESERAEEVRVHTSAASKIFANFMFALTFTVISKSDRTRQSREER